jgi:hypothetical protein
MAIRKELNEIINKIIIVSEKSCCAVGDLCACEVEHGEVVLSLFPSR